MKSYLLNLLTTLVVVAIGGAILHGILKPNHQKEIGKNLKTEDLVDFWKLNCWDLKIPKNTRKVFILIFMYKKAKKNLSELGDMVKVACHVPII